MLLDFNLWKLARRLVRIWRSANRPRRKSLQRVQRGFVELLESRELLTTITVTTSADVVNPADGVISLREALATANGQSGADTIVFSPAANGTISLSGGELVITDTVTIQGNGSGNTLVNAHGASRVFNFDHATGDLTLDELTLENGLSDSGAGLRFASSGTAMLTNCTISGNTAIVSFGGGISAYNGTVNLSNCLVARNISAGLGGGISSGSGSITITDCNISENTSVGGGGLFSVAGSISLFDSTVTGNSVTNQGGGIRADNGSITLANSSVTGNAATSGEGGGIFSLLGPISLTNSDISGNTANTHGAGLISVSGAISLISSTVSENIAEYGFGGGIHGENGAISLINSTVSQNFAGAGGGIHSTNGLVTLTNSTVVFNTAKATSFGGGGINLNYFNGTSGQLILKNSIVARNSASGGPGTDLSALISNILNIDHSLIGDNSGSGLVASPVPNSNGNLIGSSAAPIDPRLGPLVSNGGSTPTHALLSSPVFSPAINRGSNAIAQTSGLTTDQAGQPRISGQAVDMGAFEFQFPAASFNSSTASTGESSSTFVVTANLSSPAIMPVSIPFTLTGTATKPNDFTVATSQLTISTGQSTGSLTLNIVNDALIEGSETATITMGAPTNAMLGATTAIVVTIVDDDFNHPPTIPVSQAFNLPENSAPGTVVGSVVANDSDMPAPFNTLTFSINNNPGNAFNISPAGQITVSPGAVLNSEATPSITVGVTVTDGGSPPLSASQNVTINLSIVNGAPVITSSNTVSVAENVTAIRTVIAADPDVGQTLTFSIAGGTDAGRFVIDPTNGILSFLAAQDFENPTDMGVNNVYDVTVKVTDNGAGKLFTMQNIAVTVTNVNEAPAITSVNSTILAENATVVLTVAASDPDVGQTLTFTIVGGADAARFAINPTTGVLGFASPPNFESPTDVDSDNIYHVTVKATDNGAPNLFAIQAIAVTVINANDPPTVTSVNSMNIAENSTAILTLTASDEDPGESLTFTIAGGTDAARFTINPSSGVLARAVPLNFEVPTDGGANNVYDVTVKVTDNGAGNLFVTQNIAVTITNVNEAPAINSAFTASIVENTATVLTVTGTDPDVGQALTFSISGGPDAAKFTINPTTGVLRFAITPNFEIPTDFGANNVYDVTVKATDNGSGNLFGTQDIVVTVTNINEAPTIKSGNSISVAENSNVALAVNATDPELGQLLTFLISGGVDASKFLIDPATGVLTFVTPPDFENPSDTGANNLYDVTIKVADNGPGTLFTTQNLVVIVNNVNEAPVIVSSNSPNVAENSNAVVTVTAMDADAGQSLTFSISGGADATRFTINPNTGILAFVGSPNFEIPADAGADNVYNVTVHAMDNGTGSLFGTQDIAVTVSDINEPPTITSVSTGFVAENATTVFTLAASDQDTGQSLTFSISGGADAARLTIDPSTGVLAFATPPDFEAPFDAGGNNIYDVIIKTIDNGPGSLFNELNLSVTVSDIDEAPVISSPNTISVSENSTGVMVITGANADAGQSLTFSIVGGIDAARFTINAMTGALAFVIAPSFETPTDSGGNNVYEVLVAATDNGPGSLSVTQNIAVTITDVNEVPILTPQTFSVAENSSANAPVGKVVGVDPENGILSFSILNGSPSIPFAIDAATGQLAVLNPRPTLDFEATPTFTLQIQLTDNINTPVITTITINLTNVIEAPVLSGGSDTITFIKKKPPVALMPNIIVAVPEGATSLGRIVISYFVPKGCLPGDVSANLSGLGSVAESGPTSFKKSGGQRALSVTLNDGVTAMDVQNALRGLSFSTKKFDPKNGPLGRRIDVQVSDKSGNPSNTLSAQIRAKAK